MSKSIKDLRAEVKELKDAFLVAHNAYYKAEAELVQRLADIEREKRTKCKHTNVVKEWSRRFEGEGFVDTEYNVCKKCGEVFDVRDVNIVLKSEK